MKICSHCNREMEDGAVFCSCCGTLFPDTQQAAEREQDCLYVLRRNLRHERTVWQGFGIAYLILSLLFGVIALSEVIPSYDFFRALEPFILCIFFVPYFILYFYQASALTRLEKTVYEDCSKAVERAGRVRHIVLGAVFTELAWIFALLNLIHVKNNKEILNQIIRKQQSR